MNRKLPYTEWIAAQNELEAIIRRARLVDLPPLLPMLRRAHRTLKVDAQPSVAAIELEYIADMVSRYPQLRDAVRDLSNRLFAYPMAETLPASG